MITADRDTRQRVLVYASAIAADPADAVTVIVNAMPLLAWLQRAEDEPDLRLRRACMERHHANLYFVGRDSEPVTPEQFLGSVQVLYAFLTEAADLPEPSAA